MPDSLRTPPMSDVIAALYDDAHAGRDSPPPVTDGPLTDREFFARARHSYMAVGPDVARLLYQLVRLHGARTVVEFGTSFGLSTLHLAAGVRDNGGGTVVGSEYEANKVEATLRSARDAGVGDIVEVREGDALDTLSRDLPASVDLLFLDGAKDLYLPVLDLLEPRLGPGALLVADNAARASGFVDRLDDAPGWVTSFLEGEDLLVALHTA